MDHGDDKRVEGHARVPACKRRNYITMKNKQNDRERIELKKYCRSDRAHTVHTETGSHAGTRRRNAPHDAIDPMADRWPPPRRRPRRLRRAACGDVRRHLHARLRLTGNEEDARDVVQEAYLRAYRGLQRFRGDAQFSTWLYRITANCAATHLGRRRRHRHEELADDAPVADARPERRPPGPGRGVGDLRDRLTDGPRRAPAAAAGRGRAARRLRPAPRGHRGRARHLRDGGQGAPPPGPRAAARAGRSPTPTSADWRGGHARAV